MFIVFKINKIVKAAGAPLLILTLLFAASGCANLDTNETAATVTPTPSPSPQDAPSPVASETESEDTGRIASPNTSIYPDSETRENPEFKSILILLEETTNSGRFEEINLLLGIGFIDKKTADTIYLNVEEGNYETLAYQMYLYQKSMEK